MIYQNEINKLIDNNKWIKAIGKGSASVGITLETLLGKEIENFEIPDYHGIEIKTKYSLSEEYLTLFNATPDSYLFEIKRITNEYGYRSKDLPNYKVLNIGVLGNRKTKLPSNYYFKLSVDWTRKNVILNIYDKNLKLIDNKCAWSFQMLKEKLERKLSTLAYIKAERKWDQIERAVYFKYTEITFYKLKSFEQFIKLIENGRIKILFKIGIYKSGKRKGQIHDHGTSFSIKDCNLQYLFNKIQQ